MNKTQIIKIDKQSQKNCFILDKQGTPAKYLQVSPVFEGYKFKFWAINVSNDEGYVVTLKTYNFKQTKKTSVNSIFEQASQLANKFNLIFTNNPRDISQKKFSRFSENQNEKFKEGGAWN